MNRWDTLRASPAFAALLETSERLGRDPLQVQGPGGNTSLKQDGAMWIKASGTWLAEARERDIMVPVDAEAMVRAVDTGEGLADDPAAFMPADVEGPGLRASIETSVHASLEAPVVLHTHCVATIAMAVRADAEAMTAVRLAGLGAVFVPYARPGLDLARAIRARVTWATRVVILGNHGLVTGGATTQDAEALLVEVRERLEPAHIAPPSGIDPVFAARLEGTGWMPAPDGMTQAIAKDPARLALARGATLYPDHLVFLGPGVAIARPGEGPAQTAARHEAVGAPLKLWLSPGQGAAVPVDAGPSMLAMARCLGDVLARIAPGTELNRLSIGEEAALLDWDAEKHRQSLEAARKGRA